MEKNFYDRENKEFVKQYKLMFSSLFARKMGFVYIDKANPTTAFFSSMEPDNLMVNMPTVECMLHKVTGDVDLYTLLNTYIEFDRLEGSVYAIDIKKLAEQVRMTPKRDDFIAASILEKENNRVYVHRNRKVHGEPVVMHETLFATITKATMQYLEDMISAPVEWIANANKKTTLPLDIPLIVKSGVNFIDISENEEHIGGVKFSDGTVHFITPPLKDGFTVISLSEFGKKDKKSEPKFRIELGQIGPVVRAYFVYEGLVKVVSVQPTYIFIARNRKGDKS